MTCVLCHYFIRRIGNLLCFTLFRFPVALIVKSHTKRLILIYIYIIQITPETMSQENSPVLSRKTWARTMEPVTKIGYMDGAANGQASVYQQSFDVGYEQGYCFGMNLGFKEAALSMKQQKATSTNTLLDPRKINCQICLNGATSQDNIGNLYNIQKEKNLEVLE